MDIGGGNDIITGISSSRDAYESAIVNSGSIDTSDGNDIITGMGGIGIYNFGTITTGSGKDSIISLGKIISYDGVFLEDSNEGIINRGGVFLGDGNDSIIVDADVPNRALVENFNFIETGDGNDIITSTGIIYNEGIINTGKGDDSIIADEGIDGIGSTEYGIYNNGGSINTGNGNDPIIANGGFESGLDSSGSVFLGDGEDYIKSFGSGDFYGGNGNDTLELTPGTYTVGIWGEGGESPIFTKGNQLMITSEFEQLIAGGTIYDFTSLTAGQIIVVA
jgi:hypothetical protein